MSGVGVVNIIIMSRLLFVETLIGMGKGGKLFDIVPEQDCCVVLFHVLALPIFAEISL